MVAEHDPPRRVDFSSTDPLETRDFLDDSYGWRMRLPRPTAPAEPLSVSMVAAGPLISARAVAPGDLSYSVRGDDYVVIDTLQGTFELEHPGGVDRYGRGDVYIANYPDAEFTSSTHDIRVLTTTLPCSVLDDVANLDPEAEAAPVSFLAATPREGDARHWRAVSRFVDRMLNDPAFEPPPLVTSALVRNLAAAALTTFANTATPQPTWRDQHDAHPATVRRAVAFIEANPDIDISLGDIARAAGTTPRAVEIAFRRHLDSDPLAELRRVRLAEAHRELEDAQRVDRGVLAEVASRWGYPEVDRFVAEYTAAYRRPPEARG